MSRRGKVRLGIALGVVAVATLLAVAVAGGRGDDSKGPTGTVGSPSGGSGSPAGGSGPPPPGVSGPLSDGSRTSGGDVDSDASTRQPRSIPVADSTPPRPTRDSDPSTLRRVTTDERVKRGEALPCTKANQPINFEVFSAGPRVAGLKVTSFKRRCGATTPTDETPRNFTNYIYGNCEPARGASSCVPPLEIQTWPACERSLADYSFGGKPMPYRRLASDSRAVVVEIQFEFGPRIEVYSKSSTIVIFAADLALAEEAVAQLTSQGTGNPPAARAGELKGQPNEDLAPPSDGAMEGELSC